MIIYSYREGEYFQYEIHGKEKNTDWVSVSFSYLKHGVPWRKLADDKHANYILFHLLYYVIK